MSCTGSGFFLKRKFMVLGTPPPGKWDSAKGGWGGLFHPLYNCTGGERRSTTIPMWVGAVWSGVAIRLARRRGIGAFF